MTPPFANTQEMVTWLRKKLVREVIQQWLGTNGLEQLEAIADTLEAQQWQPIETAPKDGTLVLLAWPYWSSSAVVGYWKHSRWVSDAVLEDWFARHEEPGPTAWMPLPPLPAPPSTPEAQS